jgi:hypothetical protein
MDAANEFAALMCQLECRGEKDMARYQIHAIADGDCTTIHPEVLATTDDVIEAKRLAATHSRSLYYGAAVLDGETCVIDYGHGTRPFG